MEASEKSKDEEVIRGPVMKKKKKRKGRQKSEVEGIIAGVCGEGEQIFYSILQGDLAVSVGNTILLERCDSSTAL